jgi:IS1 family transposase/transposase-like protein
LRPAHDWNQPCPNPACDYYKRMNRGNISAIASYMTQSGRRRVFRCSRCERSFSETRDTVFFDLRTPEEKVMMALKMLLVRVELAAICFVLGVTEETLIEWLRRVALKAEEINAQLLREVRATQIQLDEMWNFIARKCSQGSDSRGESLAESDGGRQWIWLSYAPEYRLIVAALVGPRTFQSAWRLIQMTAAVLGGVPAFFSDGLNSYLPALIAVYHRLKVFPRTGKRGRPRKPVLEPDEELKISTRLIERVNQTFRHALSPLVRKSRSFCKAREQMRRRVVFFHTFYNFARPHMSLRVEIPAQHRVSKGMIQPKWKQRTPAMAAGLTDHLWMFRELLTAKFEPIHYQSISG